MIPDGWLLVPVVPTERMLTEFSGVWAPWLPKSRRELELKAYADMLAVVPTPPTHDAECDVVIKALKLQVQRLKTSLNKKTEQCDKAYNKIRSMHSEIESLRGDRDDARDRNI